ncbi:MAG: PDZ domain-containing protein [Gemmatimonadaceae bacterium]|nr:PDZ domain-containing protein [Gemmatimonadaceae bacterium]
MTPPRPSVPPARSRARRIWLALGVVAVAGAAFGAGVATERRRAATEGEWSDARLLSSAIDSVRVNALDSLPSDELIRRAVSGMLRELHDPYAALLRPDSYERYRGSLLGEGYGVGLTLRRQREPGAHGREPSVVVSVARVAPGSPAMTAGVRAGDRILAVDGVPIAEGWGHPAPKADSAAPRSTALPATERLTLWRAPQGDTATVEVRRVSWHMPAVSEQGMLTDSVGYVRLATMSAKSSEELEHAVDGLVDRGARALVLDLRGNTGGLFEEGVRAAGLFLPRGAVVASLAGRAGAAPQPHRGKRSRWADLPLTVLVDGNTASAAEVVAAALHDYDRALLVGAPTYGKGVVQRVVTLSTDLSLRLTTARWLTPRGVSLQRRQGTGADARGGLLPDVVVDDATRRDPYTVPAGWGATASIAVARAADSVAMQALRDGWAVSPLALLESRLRMALTTRAPATVRDAVARAEWMTVATRMATVRVLEVERENEALLRYGVRHDATMRAGLDVVAPGAVVGGVALR